MVVKKVSASLSHQRSVTISSMSEKVTVAKGDLNMFFSEHVLIECYFTSIMSWVSLKNGPLKPIFTFIIYKTQQGTLSR